MTLCTTVGLASFARLIALGYPPVLAAKAAGCRNLRASRAATRLAPHPAVGGPKKPRAPVKAKTTKAADDAPPMEWPPARMPTEEEWMAEFAPLIERETGAPA
jgi:hypothetical protein